MKISPINNSTAQKKVNFGTVYLADDPVFFASLRQKKYSPSDIYYSGFNSTNGQWPLFDEWLEYITSSVSRFEKNNPDLDCFLLTHPRSDEDRDGSTHKADVVITEHKNRMNKDEDSIKPDFKSIRNKTTYSFMEQVKQFSSSETYTENFFEGMEKACNFHRTIEREKQEFLAQNSDADMKKIYKVLKNYHLEEVNELKKNGFECTF